MSKKHKVAQPVAVNAKGRSNVVWRQSAEEATLVNKPHYNGFACGHGAHGSAKFNRAKAKQAWEKQIRQEGASRGSFLFVRRVQLREPYSVAASCPAPPKRMGPAREDRARREGICGA